MTDRLYHRASPRALPKATRNSVLSPLFVSNSFLKTSESVHHNKRKKKIIRMMMMMMMMMMMKVLIILKHLMMMNHF